MRKNWKRLLATVMAVSVMMSMANLTALAVGDTAGEQGVPGYVTDAYQNDPDTGVISDVVVTEPPAESEVPVVSEPPAATEVPVVTEVPVSEAVEAFLDAVAALPGEVTQENFEEVSALMAACQEAYDALAPEDLEREDVMEGVEKMAELMEAAMLFNEVDGVAMIGETSYATFPEAMTALKEGETLVLLADVNSDGMYMVSSANNVPSDATQVANNITVDLNGHTITPTGVAAQTGTKYAGYGVFRAKGEGYTLTIANGDVENVGTIKGKVVNSTASTINLNGPGKLDIVGENGSRAITTYGDININAPLDKLTVTANMGNITVGENGSVTNLTVNMPAPTSNNNTWERSLTVNGTVANLTVDQKTAHSMYSTRITHSVLVVNSPIETLKLTQGQAGGYYRADLWNKAYIYAPVGTMTASQSGKVSELYLFNTVDVLDLTLSKNYGNTKINDVPVTQVGPGFQVGQLNFARLNLVNFADPNIRNSYANPMTEVEDLVLVTGMDGHEITAGQVSATAWGLSNTSSGIGGTKLEYTDPVSGIKDNYKYLTTAQVIDGQIVLHKTVLTGIPKVVYLNGTKGNDNNDGSSATKAVKTFAKAAELLGTDDGLKTIYVSGTVTISGAEEWALPGSVNGTVKRYNTFKNGALINVPKGASLTLSNIVIDGGKGENVSASAPLVTVQANAALTLNEGAVLQNNTNTGNTRGGAINNKGTLTINDGGLIQKNSTVESGGGIYSTGNITMTGGEIVGNESTAWSGAKNSKSTGGGICIGQNGTMEMNGGRIADNRTLGKLAFGGGIALGDCASRSGMKLVMTDGVIEGNKCKGNGGGIAVWTGGEAKISGGNIINNACNSGTVDWDLSYYGGGGIYVNKGATLKMTTVEVTNNRGTSGNGIAACPTSDVHFYVKNGGVFYGSGSGIWISTTTGGGGNVPVTLPGYTLNGYKYNWNDGTETLKDLNLVLPRGESIGLTSGLTDAQGKDAAQYCNVHITGNSSGTNGHAYPGGGIGCNGTLIIGEDSNILAVEKKVDGTSPKPFDTEFKFTVAFTTADKAPYAQQSVLLQQKGENQDVTTDDEGKLEFTLVKDECVVFRDLPVGVKYTITEGDNKADKVTVTHTVVTKLENLNDRKDPEVTTVTEETKEANGTTVAGQDEVVFTNTYDAGKLTIKKAVRGGPDSAKNARYEFTVTGEDYSKDVYVIGGDSVTLENLVPGTYTITEKDAKIEGYTWDVQGTGDVTVNANETTIAQINNKYTEIPKYGSLTVVKAVSGGPTSASTTKVYTFTISGPEAFGTQSVTITGAGHKTLENLVPGVYTVSEVRTDLAISGYNYSVSGEGAVTVELDKTTEITITNTYTTPDEPDEPDPTPDPDPDPTPTPTVTPEPTPEPEPTPTPVEELEEPDVPLADLPKDPEEFEELADEDGPLASVPETGDAMLAWASAAALSGLGLAFLSRKKKEESN